MLLVWLLICRQHTEIALTTAPEFDGRPPSHLVRCTMDVRLVWLDGHRGRTMTRTPCDQPGTGRGLAFTWYGSVVARASFACTA